MDEEKQPSTHHMEKEGAADAPSLSSTSKAAAALTLQAQAASTAEHNTTFLQAICTHRRAVLWSILVSTAIVMEGYDIVLVHSLFAQPAFQRRYGAYWGPDTGWQVSGPWQVGLQNATTVGTIIGAFANGWLTDRVGYRKVLLVSLAAITGFVFLTFFAKNLVMLCVGEILCGIPWGAFATLAPAYAAEVCPLALRGYLTVYVNLCWAVGQLIAAGVLQGCSKWETQWAYRVPFAIQWAWPLPLFAILFFAPESPWWLVRRGRLADAKAALSRLCSPAATGADLDASVALMQHTERIEQEMQSGSTYAACFRGVDARRTEVVCVVFAAQVLSGQPLGGGPTYFFTQAGLPVSTSFSLSVGGLGLACVGTIASWFMMARLGRRTIYVCGLAALSALMFAVGVIEVATAGAAGQWAMGGVVLGWLFTYYVSVGPICYALVSETSSAKLRSKSVCLARISYYIAQIVGYVAQPYMINPTEGNLKGKTAFVWAATGFLCFVWAFWRLPETKGRTYEELDIMFARRLPARRFAGYEVDAYEDDVEHVTKA